VTFKPIWGCARVGDTTDDSPKIDALPASSLWNALFHGLSVVSLLIRLIVEALFVIVGVTLLDRLTGVTGEDSNLNGIGEDDFERVGVIGISLKLGLVGTPFILLSKCSAWDSKVLARDIASCLRVGFESFLLPFNKISIASLYCANW
jgi:hypothetical protein